jgi:hypothetical protein
MPAFNSLVRAKGAALLSELDNWLSAQDVSPTATKKAGRRLKTGVGIYHFVSDD